MTRFAKAPRPISSACSPVDRVVRGGLSKSGASGRLSWGVAALLLFGCLFGSVGCDNDSAAGHAWRAFRAFLSFGEPEGGDGVVHGRVTTADLREIVRERDDTSTGRRRLRLVVLVPPSAEPASLEKALLAVVHDRTNNQGVRAVWVEARAVGLLHYGGLLGWARFASDGKGWRGEGEADWRDVVVFANQPMPGEAKAGLQLTPDEVRLLGSLEVVWAELARGDPEPAETAVIEVAAHRLGLDIQQIEATVARARHVMR